jgi:hypothetical protein
MSTEEPAQPQEYNQLRIAILLVILVLAYLFAVLSTSWSHKVSSHFYHAIGNDCLKKYHATLVPKSDKNFWLLDDYEEITFHVAIFSDPECTGKLITLGTTYIKRNPERHQLVIRFLDPTTMQVISRIAIKP